MKLSKLFLLLVAVLVLSSCAIKENVKDGYQAGDVASGAIEDYRLYCSAPFVGLRAVGRFIIAALGGVTVPDACALVQGVVRATKDTPEAPAAVKN